jgi:ABC-type nickel/cobalt efflux system permease component RcnA
VGWVLAGSLVVLWIVTRFLAAPFHGSPEPMDLGVVVCKLAEALGLISLTALALTGATSAEQRRGAWRNLALLLVLSVVVGLATYGVARAAEPLFPALAASHETTDDHQHDADHSHGETQDAGQTQQEQPQADHTHEHGGDGHTH